MISALPLWIIAALFGYFALSAFKWWWRTPVNDVHEPFRQTVLLWLLVLAAGTGLLAWTMGGKP